MSTLPPDSAPSPAPAAGPDHDALPPGTRFGEFEILRVLGVGGFGIVYLANDHSLEREVALKEYMPASLAARGAGPQITVRSSSFAETYAIGLRSFVNEARLLARFDHPSLVKVYRFWEDNATAYMVMPYLQGVTLRDTRRRMAHPPDEPWIRSVIAPILSALELLHREGVYHRDIAPDNILLPHDGPAGAARLRRGAARHQRPHPVAHRDPQAELRADRAVRRDDAAAAGPMDRPLRARRGDPLPAVRRPAGTGDGARRPGRCRSDREPHRPRRVAALPRGRFLDALGPAEPAPQSGEQLRAVLDGHAQIPPRGRPGITIPPNVALPGAPPPAAYPPSQPPGPSQRPQVETVRDATLVNTAHNPTHLPTAQILPPGQDRAPAATLFSPTAHMPTARSPQQTTEFDPSLASRGPASMPPPMPPVPPAGRTRADAGPSQWPASRPATLPPPVSQQHSRPAPLAAQPHAEPARSRPAPARRPGGDSGGEGGRQPGRSDHRRRRRRARHRRRCGVAVRAQGQARRRRSDPGRDRCRSDAAGRNAGRNAGRHAGGTAGRNGRDATAGARRRHRAAADGHPHRCHRHVARKARSAGRAGPSGDDRHDRARRRARRQARAAHRAAGTDDGAQRRAHRAGRASVDGRGRHRSDGARADHRIGQRRQAASDRPAGAARDHDGRRHRAGDNQPAPRAGLDLRQSLRRARHHHRRGEPGRAVAADRPAGAFVGPGRSCQADD
jgi:hypothetical protein